MKVRENNSWAQMHARSTMHSSVFLSCRSRFLETCKMQQEQVAIIGWCQVIQVCLWVWLLPTDGGHLVCLMSSVSAHSAMLLISSRYLCLYGAFLLVTALVGRQKPGAGQLQSERLQQQLVQLTAKRQRPSGQQDVQQPWQFTQQFHFDPADCGSFPCKQQLHTAMWKDLAACHQAVAQALAQHNEHAADTPAAAAAGSCDPLQNPFGWVPDDQDSAAGDADSNAAPAHAADASAQERISSIRPRTAQIRSRTATSLPLEFFDSPEMEQVDIQQRLQDAAAEEGTGLQALSRFYSPDGAFSWKPCTVLQYDRYAQWTLFRWFQPRTWQHQVQPCVLIEGTLAGSLRQLQRSSTTCV